MNISHLAKVELHLHLEGAAPPAFIRQLAYEKKVDIGGIFAPDGRYAFGGFTEFLAVYEAATQVLQSPEDFHRLTLAVLAECAANDVIYVESFLSPEFCGGGDLSAWREYLQAIREAAAQAEVQHGILMRGIPTCIRHLGPERAKLTARCAAETADDWIVGFGMGGDEMQGRQDDFAYSFDMAHEAGLHLTSHAGEWGGAASVWQAIDGLKVGRIGHGVQPIEDPALVKELVAREIVLEVCPGSNVALGVTKTLATHPIRALREAGVKVTVSTDDPPFFSTTMRQEYQSLAEAYDWTADDFRDLNATAAAAAFCDEGTRGRVLEKLELP